MDNMPSTSFLLLFMLFVIGGTIMLTWGSVSGNQEATQRIEIALHTCERLNLSLATCAPSIRQAYNMTGVNVSLDTCKFPQTPGAVCYNNSYTNDCSTGKTMCWSGALG